MLLNLVRLKYRDTPFFLQVSSVSTQYSFSGDASIGVAVPDGGNNLYSGGLGVSYSEAPTVSYAPLQGDEFVERLLSPVSLEALTLLTGSGWSVERVMRTRRARPTR